MKKVSFNALLSSGAIKLKRDDLRFILGGTPGHDTIGDGSGAGTSTCGKSCADLVDCTPQGLTDCQICSTTIPGGGSGGICLPSH